MLDAEENLDICTFSLIASNFSVCLPHDQVMSEHLSQAILALNASDFSFFDLALHETERRALSLVEVEHFRNWGVFDDELEYLPEISEVFVRSFALSKANAETAKTVASLITRLAYVIASESGYDSCKVMLRTYPSNHTLTPEWHVDKTFEEIIGADTGYNRTVFTITLKGASTLFYPTSFELREPWNKAAEESAFTYGGKRVQHLLSNHSQIVSAGLGQGSVHKAGQTCGSIHASPYSEAGRFLLLVLPGPRHSVQALQRFEDSHLHESLESSALNVFHQVEGG